MNLLSRIVTGVLGAILLLTGAWFGGLYFGGVVLAIAIIGQWEWYGLLHKVGMKPWRLTGLIIGIFLVLHPLFPGGIRLALIPLALLLVWMPFTRYVEPLHTFCATISGALYPAALLSFLLYLRGMDAGAGLVITVLVSVWVSDSCAYAAGRLWGRHSLAPTTSPNKTWEGYFAGVLGPPLFGAVIHFVLSALNAAPHLGHVLVLAVICGLARASGDLAESRFKRAARVDESGSLLPGHGGVRDRFDGMIAAAPLAYLYIWIVG